MAIILERKINADAGTIFKAITTKKGYQGWWAAVCDIDCKLDHLSSIRFEKEHIIEEMVFKTAGVKENEKLVWLCTVNNVFYSWVGTRLTFEIRKNGSGNNFIFTQTSADKDWKKHADYSGSLAGWEFFLDSLKSYCETGEGEPW